MRWCVGRLAYGEARRAHAVKAEESPQFAGIRTRPGKAASTAPASVTRRGGVTCPGKLWMGLGDNLPDAQPWGSWKQRLTLRGVRTGGDQCPPPRDEIPLSSVGGMDGENLLFGDLTVNVEVWPHLNTSGVCSRVHCLDPRSPSSPQVLRGIRPSLSETSLGTALPAPSL